MLANLAERLAHANPPRSMIAALSSWPGVTAIPALALPVVARSGPFERIRHHTRELEEAMREAYGVEVETLTFPKTDDGKPIILVVAHTLR